MQLIMDSLCTRVFFVVVFVVFFFTTASLAGEDAMYLRECCSSSQYLRATKVPSVVSLNTREERNDHECFALWPST